MDQLLRSKKYILLFVGIPFAVFAVFGILPIVYNVYLSLFQTNLLSKGMFVGLQNYVRLFRDPFFQKAFSNNLILIAACYAAHMGLAIVLANLLYNRIRGGRFFQSVLFMPSIICGTAIGLLWKFVYHPEFGILNALLQAVGLGSLAQNWLANRETVMAALVVVTMWQFVGYHMVIQLAAMRDIDRSILEAAEIDGAGPRQRLTRIILPLIKPVLAVDSVLIITGSLKLYDLVSVMTNGGPNHASDVLSLYIYKQAFINKNFGYASAISTVLLILCVLITVVVKRAFRDREE